MVWNHAVTKVWTLFNSTRTVFALFFIFGRSNANLVSFSINECLVIFSGSFVVVDTQALDEMIGFHHRKEEISDVKFSPGK